MSERLFTGIMAGAAWNAASLWCLTHLLRAWLGPTPSRRRALGWLMIKFPLLYLLAFALISNPHVSVVGFGVGFTLVLLGGLAWYARHLQRMEPHRDVPCGDTGARPHGR